MKNTATRSSAFRESKLKKIITITVCLKAMKVIRILHHMEDTKTISGNLAKLIQFSHFIWDI